MYNIYIYIYIHSTCIYIYIYIYTYYKVVIGAGGEQHGHGEARAGDRLARQSESCKRGRIKRDCSQKPDLQIGFKTGPRNMYR